MRTERFGHIIHIEEETAQSVETAPQQAGKDIACKQSFIPLPMEESAYSEGCESKKVITAKLKRADYIGTLHILKNAVYHTADKSVNRPEAIAGIAYKEHTAKRNGTGIRQLKYFDERQNKCERNAGSTAYELFNMNPFRHKKTSCDKAGGCVLRNRFRCFLTPVLSGSSHEGFRELLPALSALCTPSKNILFCILL